MARKKQSSILISHQLNHFHEQIDARDREIMRLNDLVTSNKGCHGSLKSGIESVRNEGGDEMCLREKMLDLQSLQQDKVELEKKLAGINLLYSLSYQ